MKKIILILSVTCICCLNARLVQGQVNDDKLARSILQQNFLKDNYIFPQIRLRPLNASNQTMDSLFSVFNQEWGKYILKQSTPKPDLNNKALLNLDSYSYMWSFLSITQKLQLDRNVEYHLYSKYMFPSLLVDYNNFKENRSDSYLKLIWLGSLKNTLTFGTQAHLSQPDFSSLYSFYTGLKNLLESYSSPTAKGKVFVSDLLKIINDYKFEMECKNLYYQGHPEEAMNYLLKESQTNQVDERGIVDCSKILLDHYYKTGQKDNGLAILNNMAKTVGKDAFPLDSLKSWYLKIDPALAEENYRKATGLSEKIQLVRDNSSAYESFKYLNLNQGDIDNDKIHNAKYLLIDFWSLDCGPCIAEIKELNALYEKIKNRKDVYFISVNCDKEELKKDTTYIKAMISKYNISYPVLYNTQAIKLKKLLHVQFYPSKFIFESTGHLLNKSNHSDITLSTFETFVKN
ncbi:TlpA family protein disulfide reductase [Mucilaginibacter paludis]|uniref:Alkyl hydroperoxide reductase/ Thiol specific antioxidant/ Mal allergen n=1 Tax=Mucilaginibacter paludis DSM 18603 TaxID=714943 RepID=H1XZ97_9SPHI|nr:TlpA disulfide reductase family protein [Mucilaginibacter paludis]EHQ25585.1 alkyl hydroperoxide reductase/ Thiol specific antioxidant/ Mal allergen [Mucilaginibacter paludis DSM 18603]